jgi:hypothetical protein
MMRTLTMRLGGSTLAAVLGLALAAGAAAAQVPQPRELEAALGRLDLRRDEGPARISHDRFPLYFPVDRDYGIWRSPNNNSVVLGIHGHGHSARRHRSVSLEMLFGDSAWFDAGLAHTEGVMAAIGLPDEVRAAAAEMLRTAHTQRQAQRRAGEAWYLSRTREAREVAGIQVRMRFEDFSHVFLQFTDADAPEARWPTRDDVERLHPHTHRRTRPEAFDLTLHQDPVVTRLRCRNARSGAFRCSYLLDNTTIPGRPVDRYTGLFRRSADGEWTLAIDQPPHGPDTD